jgi:hypothetical protein
MSSFDYATALNQLTGSTFGVGRLVAMIGACDFVTDPRGRAVSFRFKARATNGAKRLRLRLDADDTYTMEFISLQGRSKGEIGGLYADNLKGAFERATGLYLSL